MEKTQVITRDVNKNNLTNSSKRRENSFEEFQKQEIVKNLNFDNSKYNSSINPFITASTPLFEAVLDIEENRQNLNVDQIRDEFISRVNSFNEKCVENKTENMEILVARYILCTFIDEKLNEKLSDNDNWFNRSLLSIFHNETYGGENFFHLLDKFLKTPAKYINILELMYICLSLGFLGRYRVVNKGEIEISNIKESLYRQIKIVQGREPLTFYKKVEPSQNKFKLFNKISYPLLISLIIILIVLIYLFLSFKLYERNIKISQDIDNIELNKIENINKENK